MSRVGKEQDRMESAGIEFFKRTREGYLEIAKNEPDRVKLLQGTDTIENIHNQILDIISDL